MPTLDATDLATLHAELQGAAYTGLSDAQRFTAFHTPSAVANPINPAPQVPKPFGFADIMGVVSPASRANIRNLATGSDLIAAINAQDRANIGHWLIGLMDPPALITQTEEQAVAAVLSATIADPAWSATVPGPSRKDVIFPGKTWTKPTGETVDFVPLEDFGSAR